MYTLMATTAGFPEVDFEEFYLPLRERDFDKARLLPPAYVTISNAAETLPPHEGGWTKCLSRGKIAETVRRLRGLHLYVVQLGTREDPPIPGVDRDLRGETSLKEAAAVLQKALVNVGPEGGIVNLARAVRTPSVVFFGSTPAEFFAMRANVNILPQQCGGCWWVTPRYLHQCPRFMLDPECTESIRVEEIIGAAEVIVGKRLHRV